MCVMVANFGFATLVVPDQSFKIQRTWRFEERCTAVLFESVFVMAVYARNCKKDFDVLFHSSSMSQKSYGKDVELGPEISMSPAT